MTSKERVLARYREMGRRDALEVQQRAPIMTETELNAADDRIPHFSSAVANKNMLERPAGFVCITSAGRVVKLLQPYDSTIYTEEPEELPAQWGFVWSHDPVKAKPFISLATSPYNTGDCCTENGGTYRSRMDGNVHAPSAYPQGWEQVAV